MNRAQRRTNTSHDLVQYMKVPESVIGYGLHDGDTFTISGMKVHKDGRISRDCKPGEETEFTAKVTHE